MSDPCRSCPRRFEDFGGCRCQAYLLAGDPAPSSLWIWIGLSGLAVAVAVLGWRGSRWWRRGVSLLAIPLCLLGAGVALNLWVGYVRTVQDAWNQVTAGPLPDETDMGTVMAMRGKGAPAHGALVRVSIPDDGSGFKHRTELVYLPPAWFGDGVKNIRGSCCPSHGGKYIPTWETEE